MKIVQSFAFRFWLIFTLMGLAISIPLSNYYRDMQFAMLQKHTQEEFDNSAKVSAHAVINALELDDYTILTRLLKDLKEHDQYAFIALVEKNPDGSKNIIACNPAYYKNKVLLTDKTLFNYSYSSFSNDVMIGEVVLASSKLKDKEILKELNGPIVYLSVFAGIASMILFGFSLFFFTKPIFKAIEVAKSLSAQNYNVQIDSPKGKDEISILNRSLITLKDNLINLEQENNKLMGGLESQIEAVTNEIRNRNNLNKLLLAVSQIFLEKNDQLDMNEVVLKTFIKISQSLEFKHMGIFQVENGGLHCQYNPPSCPISNLSIKPGDFDFAAIFSDVNKHLTLFRKDSEVNSSFIKKIFSEIPSAEIIYLYHSDDSEGKNEIILIVAENESTYRTEELNDMLEVYFTLYSNYCQGKAFEAELKLLNKTLENKVLEKTRVNLEISNTLIAQDKLVTIGELSAGVAHDLNTPLAAIKAASQNLGSILESLIFELKGISSDELNFIMDHVKHSTHNYSYRTGLEKMSRIEDLRNVLDNSHPNGNNSELSRLFVEANIESKDSKDIEYILALTNPVPVLKSIAHFHVLNSFISMIDSSVEKSSMVISNLNLFTREDLTQKKEPIDLFHSVKIVENLFRFRLSGKIELITEVLPNSLIMGIEMKLFQIWTNLVKNAIDAFEDSEIDQKYIKISSESDDQSIKIHIENNGPQIPEENVKRIFKKFFTTKQNINGTGLGLSIVSNIVEEHYGKISLTSDEKKTTFTITFPKLENTKAEQ